MDPSQLPTTTIELLGLITIANISALGLVVKYFLGAQKIQTELYMKYIEQKNGNLERVTANFTQTMNDSRGQFEKMLTDQGERHRQMMDDASARLDSCNNGKIDILTKPKRKRK